MALAFFASITMSASSFLNFSLSASLGAAAAGSSVLIILNIPKRRTSSSVSAITLSRGSTATVAGSPLLLS